MSDGSCDTEDWRNDAENSALITGKHFILKYITNSYISNISKYYCNFYLINAAFLSIRNFFQKSY